MGPAGATGPADIETRVYQQFLNAPKIPFNATGWTLLRTK